MKICIPMKDNAGVSGLPYAHFGSAPFFLIYQTETEDCKVMDNNNLHHVHGACNPLEALAGESVNAIIVGGIGGRAIMKLNEMGIKVFRAAEGSVKDNIDLLCRNKLEELGMADACVHNHGCSD